MKQTSRLILSTSPPAKTGGKPPGLQALRCRRRLPCRGLRYRPVVKELDAETGLYYYGARYLDPKTSRWLSGDPAMQDYIPVAPVNDEAKKQNQNLPGMGGVFNHVNLHAYHYAGNNPVKYTDPDGEQAGPPPAQRPNPLPPTNIPYRNEPAYQGMMTRHERAEAIAGAMSTGSNAIGIIIDKIFLGGRHQEATNKYAIKTLVSFIEVQRIAARMVSPDDNGLYSEDALRVFTDHVNSSMIFNFSDQRELGPYQGSVRIPQITRSDAYSYLNGSPHLRRGNALE